MTATKKLFLASLAACISGCSSMPASGPTRDEVFDSSSEQTHQPGYVLVDINSKILNVLKHEDTQSLRATFGDTASALQGTIQPGDRVMVGIWETGAAKLFSSNGSTQAQLTPIPEQLVAADGTILVPYVGRLRISGLSPPDAQGLIQEKLHNTASQPQVMVSIVQSISDVVTVSGDNIHGSLMPLSLRNDRVLDVIAQSGGIESPAYAAEVQLIRQGVSTTVPLQNVIQDPNENIQLHPGDTLVISKNPEFFTALGATGKSTQVPFGAPQVNLIEALGLAGGLIDERADTGGVFVFRYESSALARRLCGDCAIPEGEARIPVVFHFDMSQAQALFDAEAFRMTHHDLLYIANAPEVQVSKVLAIIRDMMSPVLTGAVLDRAVTQK